MMLSDMIFKVIMVSRNFFLKAIFLLKNYKEIPSLGKSRTKRESEIKNIMIVFNS